MQFINIKTKSINLNPKLLSLNDIVNERGTTVTEKENDRVKVFLPSDTIFFLSDAIKRNARAQSISLNFGSDIFSNSSFKNWWRRHFSFKREKCVYDTLNRVKNRLQFTIRYSITN